jgi:hypothetical protein
MLHVRGTSWDKLRAVDVLLAPTAVIETPATNANPKLV